MSLQHRPQCAELSIPQPDRVVPPATGQRASIRTPGYTIHSLRMSHQRLETAPAGGFLELDGAIPARAGENAVVGGKGQAAHQGGMPGERLPHVPIPRQQGQNQQVQSPGLQRPRE